MLAAASGKADAVTAAARHGRRSQRQGIARGETALMFAANFNRVDAMKALIEKGADVNGRDQSGRSRGLDQPRRGVLPAAAAAAAAAAGRSGRRADQAAGGQAASGVQVARQPAQAGEAPAATAQAGRGPAVGSGGPGAPAAGGRAGGPGGGRRRPRRAAAPTAVPISRA